MISAAPHARAATLYFTEFSSPIGTIQRTGTDATLTGAWSSSATSRCVRAGWSRSIKPAATMVSRRLARELTGRFLECACPLALSVGAFPLVAAAPGAAANLAKRQRTAALPKLAHAWLLFQTLEMEPLLGVCSSN